MILFWTDANDEIATGHLMRCITIATELQKKGEESMFAIASNLAVSLLENRFNYFKLKNSYMEINGEYEEILELLKKYPITRCVVDSYFVNKELLEKLNKKVPVLYFDDFCKEKYEVDFVLNYNGFSEVFDYETIYEGCKTKLMIGTTYVPLREEFQNVNYEGTPGIKNICMMCGGGSGIHLLTTQLTYFQKQEDFSRFDYWIIIGGKYDGFDELKAFEKNSNVHIYVRPKSIVEIMRKCDLAISAASTVLYELSAVGVPTIFYEVSSDQSMDKHFFSKCMVYAGDLLNDNKNCLENIWANVIKISDNNNLWEKLHSMMRYNVNSKGAERIVESLLQ